MIASSAERARELSELAESKTASSPGQLKPSSRNWRSAQSRERELAELAERHERELAEIAEGREREQAERAESRERDLAELTEREHELAAVVERRDRELSELAENRERDLAELTERHQSDLRRLEELNGRLREEVEQLRAALTAPEPDEPAPAVPASHLVFVQLDERYELISRDGPPPAPSTPLSLPDVDEGLFVVAGRRSSPLPGDGRPVRVRPPRLSL